MTVPNIQPGDLALALVIEAWRHADRRDVRDVLVGWIEQRLTDGHGDHVERLGETLLGYIDSGLLDFETFGCVNGDTTTLVRAAVIVGHVGAYANVTLNQTPAARALDRVVRAAFDRHGPSPTAEQIVAVGLDMLADAAGDVASSPLPRRPRFERVVEPGQ